MWGVSDEVKKQTTMNKFLQFFTDTVNRNKFYYSVVPGIEHQLQSLYNDNVYVKYFGDYRLNIADFDFAVKFACEHCDVELSSVDRPYIESKKFLLENPLSSDLEYLSSKMMWYEHATLWTADYSIDLSGCDADNLFSGKISKTLLLKPTTKVFINYCDTLDLTFYDVLKNMSCKISKYRGYNNDSLSYVNTVADCKWILVIRHYDETNNISLDSIKKIFKTSGIEIYTTDELFNL